MARSSNVWESLRGHHRRRKRLAANCTGSGQNSPAARSWRRFEQLEDRCLLSLVSGLAPASLYLPSQHDLWVPQDYLTGPTPGQPLQLAMSYLTAHAADLGVTPVDPKKLAAASPAEDQPPPSLPPCYWAAFVLSGDWR